MRAGSKTLALLSSVMIVAASSACGTQINVDTPGQADGPMISIGVAANEPGMSWVQGQSYSGFSIDVATDVAHTLGYSSKQIMFHQITAQNRDELLANGTVDMIFTSYNPQSEQSDDKQSIDFAGPYLMTSQGVLVRAGEEDEYTSAKNLADHTVCVVKQTDAVRAVQSLNATLDERDTYQQCVASLLGGVSDAVVAPEPIVMGLRSRAGSEYTQVVDIELTPIAFGIGVRADQQTLLQELNIALQDTIDSGQWSEAAQQLRDSTGFQVDMSVNPPHIDSK